MAQSRRKKDYMDNIVIQRALEDNVSCL